MDPQLPHGQGADKDTRDGRKCKLPKLNTRAGGPTQQLRDQSFQYNGVQLFNCLPKSLRNFSGSQEDFKMKLDLHLERVPDEPKMGGMVPGAQDINARDSNSLLFQCGRTYGRPAGSRLPVNGTWNPHQQYLGGVNGLN